MDLPKCYLILGSNLGNKLQNLLYAIERIEKRIGDIGQKSSLYETEAWGKESENSYLNQALEVLTPHTPEELLAKIHEIEADLGRIRNEKWEDRIIDIDIVFYGHEIINTDRLVIPHAMMAERRFVLLPLNEIAAQVTHPIFMKTVQEMLTDCIDTGKVEKLLSF